MQSTKHFLQNYNSKIDSRGSAFIPKLSKILSVCDDQCLFTLIRQLILLWVYHTSKNYKSFASHPWFQFPPISIFPDFPVFYTKICSRIWELVFNFHLYKQKAFTQVLYLILLLLILSFKLEYRSQFLQNTIVIWF